MDSPERKLFNRIPYRFIILGLWISTIVGLLTFAGLFVYVGNTKMPNTEELENPNFEESTIVYSADNEELDRYFQRNRQWVKYEDLSPHLVDALIATEDIRFFDHSGIDARGTARAIAFLGTNGGGSTITQQLAKQFFTEKPARFFPKRVWQKMKEWAIAIEFERRYTKEELMAMFLNKFDFRYQANGVGSAAKIYFGKDQKDLTIPEAATFIGMLKNPRTYDPIRANERSTHMRNVVLSQMKNASFISKKEYDEFRKGEVDVSQFNRGENYSGPAPHFMSVLKTELRSLFEKHGLTKPGGAPFNLDTDGLRVYTTIDSRYQRHAEAAARENMKHQQQKFFEIWEGKDPWKYFENDSDLTDREKDRKIKSRESNLMTKVEQTDRYKKLRYKYLDKIIRSITEEIPEARLYSGDIARLRKAEKDENYLEKGVSNKTFSQSQSDIYEMILKSPNWKTLKKQSSALTIKAKEAFNKKRKMLVYSYDGEVEMEMTPLDSIKYMESFLQIGSVSIDPKTGHVKAWVGGSDYKIQKYDHVKTSKRQVGSTFKPFLYTAALNNAISPCMTMRDMQQTIPAGPQFKLEEAWSPKNTRGEFTGEVLTYKEGLKRSLNSASVSLLNELGSVRPIVEVVESMGVPKGRVPEYPSIILGTPTLSVLEMTRAYSTFANDGITPKPIFIEKIVYQGVTIYEESQGSRRAINENVNYAMVQLLKNASSVVRSQLKTEFGGKTGTTNDHVDGWFMGITPDLVTGTWVGGQYDFIRFLSITEGQGGRMARPYFLDFMTRIENDESIGFNTEAKFKVPAEITITTDCDAYAVPSTELLDDPFDDEIEEIN